MSKNGCVSICAIAVLAFAIVAPPRVTFAQGEPAAMMSELAEALAEGQVASEAGLADASSGIARDAAGVFANSPQTRASIGAGETVVSDISGAIRSNPTLRGAVVERVRFLIREMGWKGDELRAILKRGDTWKPLRSGRYGFTTIEALSTVLGFYMVGVVVQGHIDHAYAEYVAEMESLGDAAEKEAYNNNMRLLVAAIADRGYQLCNGMSFADAARRLHENMKDAAVPTKPFSGIVENCTNPTSQAKTFRLSGGIDAQMKAALQEKVSKTGATLVLEGSDITFSFLPKALNAGSAPGRLEMSPRTITHTWQFTYKTGMIDRRDTTCELKEGHYNMLSPDEPMKMVGAWGGAFTCKNIVSRDGKVTSDTTADTFMMINYDQKSGDWIVIVVGVQDGQWRLRRAP